jgi:hypothetical protein
MKPLILAVLLTAAPLMAAEPPAASAPAGNPRGQAKVELGGKSVSVDYGRPSLKGRDIFALAEVGKPWRLGADAPTTLTTETDLVFGSKAAVPAGSYVLTATKVSADSWELGISKGDVKVASTPLTLAKTKASESEEMLTITLEKSGDGARFEAAWGTSTLSTPFRAAKAPDKDTKKK